MRRRELRKKNLVEKPEEKRASGRSIHKLEDNIKMDLTEIGWSIMDWIHLVQYRDH
jgi:hypothetical protein